MQREVAQAGVFRVPDPVFAAGTGAVARLELLELSPASVGGERGEPVPVDVVEAELRAGVRAFPADDDAHVIGPAREVQDPGEFRDGSTVANVAVRVQRGLPGVFIGEELVELRGGTGG